MKPEVDAIIKLALAEDIGSGDITSQLVIPEDAESSLFFVNRTPLLFCGGWVVEQVFAAIDPQIQVTILKPEGEFIEASEQLIKITGNSRKILEGERVALNFLIRMCSVATYTKKFVDAVNGTSAKILDTRKTMPGQRLLDKYACKMGGAQNHRFGLYDMVLIKDNHIAVAGSLIQAVEKASNSGLKIEVEVDTLKQFHQALETKADIIMLDNFTPDNIRTAVKANNGRKILEASGGVNLETVKALAETGVDYISVGRITASPHL